MSQSSGPRLDTLQEIAVAWLCGLFPESRNKLPVLHIGMGTGRLAEEMLCDGFYLMDAVEWSGPAVADAKRRSLADKTYKCSSRAFSLPVADGVYDAVVSMEGFSGGSLPCGALSELVRVCKPGGIALIAVQQTHLHADGGNMDRLQSAMIDLQADSFWELLVREIVPDFSDGVDKTAILYAFKICGRH
ncbi:hypothetical protein BsWGS_00349 [Bradybaena similaris]